MLASRTQDTPRIMDKLQSLVDRLSAPDLTMAEAEYLRPILLRLLDSIEVERANGSVPSGNLQAERCVGV